MSLIYYICIKEMVNTLCLKPVQNHYLNVCVLLISKDYFLVEKLVLNVGMKAF